MLDVILIKVLNKLTPTFMDILNKLLKIITAEVLLKAIVAFISIAIIRFMPIKEYADYILVLSITGIVVSVIGSSINRIYIVSETDRDTSSTTSFLSFQVLLIFIIFIVLYQIKLCNQNVCYMFLIYSITSILFMFVSTVYQRDLKFRLYYLSNLINTLIMICLFIAALVYMKYQISAKAMINIQSLSFLIVFLILGFNLLKIQEFFSIRNNVSFLRKMLLSEYAYVFFYSSIVTFLLNTDVVMLRSLGNDRNLAEFGAGFRYYSVLTIVLTSVHTLFLPLVQKTNSFEKIIDIVNQHHKLVLLLIPIILIGIVLAPFIFPIIDGGKYPNSVYVFQILSVSALISFAFSPHSNFLMKYKRFKYLLAIVSIGFVIHIIANLFVIPKFHEIGAAIVNTAIYGFVNYMFYRKSKKLIANEKAQLESGAVK